MIVSTADPTTPSSSCSSVSRWRPPTHPHGKPRQKRHHNKSRDGCLTCRRRRVKCNEQRPSCKECLKLGLKCGYTAPSPTFNLHFNQTPSSPLSRTSLDLFDLSFFVENSLELLTFSPYRFPDSHISLASDEFPENCHTRFSKFWKSLIVPMAYVEPGIMELISRFAKSHRLALTTPYDGATDYLCMLAVMAKIVDNHSPDIVILGAMIFFAYERLNSAASGDEPADQDNIHCKAIVKLLPATSNAIASSVLPILHVTWKLKAFTAEARNEASLIEIPERIESSIQARQCFSDVLRSSDMRQSLEKCLAVILQYYKEMRGKDWKECRAVLTIMTEARYLRTAFDLDTDDPTAWRRSEHGRCATVTSDSTDSP